MNANEEQGANQQHRDLRAVLQRSASSRNEEHGFEGSMEAKQAEQRQLLETVGVAGSKPEQAPPARRPRRDPLQEKRPLGEILKEAGRSALGGGIPGAMAMAIQVLSLMWLRTTMNYQYRYGTSTSEAMRALYKEGGIPRFYKGLAPALFQGPLSRFGDTASNAGTLSLLNQSEMTKDLPVMVKTGAASITAGTFRILLMPIDTTKTIMQVEGKNGLPILRQKIVKGGPQVMFHGALGAAGATMVGHFPWFYTHNVLQEIIPKQESMWGKLGRNAFIGFCSSMVSDTTSNSIRVVKTTKQTTKEPISYPEAVRMVINKDGLQGLFFRGLGTRLLANGIQAALFTVLWKGIEEALFPKKR